jgi:creatinine amidohydrolase
MTARLGALTHEEAARLRDGGAIVLVPVGAIEAHGPHLPLETDCLIAEELAARAAHALVSRGETAVIAPTLAYATAEFAAGFAGTCSISAEAFREHADAVLAALERAGFRRCCFVNAHLEPAHQAALRAATQRHPRSAALADPTARTWREALAAGGETRIDGHAGVYETSLVMAARQEAVRHARRTSLPMVTADLVAAMRAGARSFEQAGGPDAYFGDPARASAALGERIFAILVEMVIECCAGLGGSSVD